MATNGHSFDVKKSIAASASSGQTRESNESVTLPASRWPSGAETAFEQHGPHIRTIAYIGNVTHRRLRDEGEHVALCVTEFVVATPRPVRRWSEDCGAGCDSMSVMSVDIADADDDEVSDAADRSRTLHVVRPWLIEHEQRVAESHVGAGQVPVAVPDFPLLFEAEGLQKECSGPLEVVVAKQ